MPLTSENDSATAKINSRTKEMASILRESDSTLPPKFQTLSSAKSKATLALRAKQEMRKFRGTSSPDPSLEIDMDEFTSFTQHLRSSTRVLALVGAGLSVASGLSTFCGDDRRWRGIEPQELSNVEALSQDPAKVWWFFSDRMKRAQEAKPNRGHVALAKLAKEKDGFSAVNQNIDGKQTPQGYGLE
jgi:NAD-dependent deacetylase sirtuin 5